MSFTTERYSQHKSTRVISAVLRGGLGVTAAPVAGPDRGDLRAHWQSPEQAVISLTRITGIVPVGACFGTGVTRR
jgi:hypothetical protein